MTPLNKTFFDRIEARLGNITTTNGYTYSAGKIARAQLTPFKGYDLPAYNIWATNLGNVINKYGSDDRSLQVYIEVHSKTNDEPFIDVGDKLAQDLVTGLNRATTAPLVSDDISPDLGGIVDDLIFAGYDYHVGQGQDPFCAILAKFEVKYTVDQNTI